MEVLEKVVLYEHCNNAITMRLFFWQVPLQHLINIRIATSEKILIFPYVY
jgi:hypothetical protein